MTIDLLLINDHLSLQSIINNIKRMASRDLTAAFIERRNAANIRRRSSDNAGGSRMKPFGEYQLLHK